MTKPKITSNAVAFAGTGLIGFLAGMGTGAILAMIATNVDTNTNAPFKTLSEGED